MFSLGCSLRYMAATKTTKRDYQLGRKLQKVRKEKGFTQEKLAEKVSVSTTWIGYIETGYKRPNLKMIYKIARALDVKVKDIFPF